MIVIVIGMVLSGCVLDRTGQSITEAFRRDMVLHATRLENLENQFGLLEYRVGQLEELNRTRGEDEIMRMESLEELRIVVARLRGDIEVLSHDSGGYFSDFDALGADVAFRLMWLEDRAAQLEEELGVSPTPPPEMPEPAVSEDRQDSEDIEAGEETDPDALIASAEEHLSAGHEASAEVQLDRFLELYPDHERVPEALYRKAEAAYNEANYSGAVLRFQVVVDDHRDSPWAPWAMLRQGECFAAQDQNDNARLFYEDVVRLWPRTSAAEEARTKLSQ